MAEPANTIAYVRTDDAPVLPAPANTVGIQGWLIQNLFSSVLNSILTLVLGGVLLWYIWDIVHWALLTAVWTGTNREACVKPEGGATGACWPFVMDKLPQWIYGFYPAAERWRVNTVMIVAVLALIPMLIPSAPHKKWNALFLLVAFPLLTLILLTGGNFGFSWTTYVAAGGILLGAAVLLPFIRFGLEDGIAENRPGLWLAGLGLLPTAVSIILGLLVILLAMFGNIFGFIGLGNFGNGAHSVASRLQELSGFIAGFPYSNVIGGLLLAAGAALSIGMVASKGGFAGTRILLNWLAAAVAVLAAMALLDFDFGLVPVETTQWGGLLVTLVVAVTGIVASLPIGIVLALGRRSEMPVVRLLSVIFIELWRGVPLLTVLFFSSVMLPLFLPEGVTFDKLMRALIGVAIFSAAYMAEVVRAGLQAIPKGQYEGAMALGLSYWQMMNKIVLPQALKISIPNIVGNFISLFKDTTLVSIIGIFDLSNIVRTSLKDTNWSAPSVAPTGYFTLALLFWVFCFAMSRYSMYTERRLHTGHKR